MKAYLAAPSDLDLEPLRELLEARGIEPFTAYQQAPFSQQASEYIARALRAADLVVAVVVSRQCSTVYYEIGFAAALGKPILLIVSPSLGELEGTIAEALL